MAVTMVKENAPHRLPLEIGDVDAEEGLHLSIKKPASFFQEEGDFMDAVSDVVVELDISLHGEDLRVTGSLSCKIRLQCGRCLKDFEYEMEEPADIFFVPSAGEDDEEAGDDEVVPFTGDTVDLYPALRDQLLLAMPVKPLCREDCKGLCPNCGTNLNEKKCECGTSEMDERLAVLMKLKKKER